MASVNRHLTQWKHNRRCAQSIGREFRDWQVNVIFYAALHAVDAVLAQLNIPVSDHESRNHAVRTNEAFVSIRKKYADLYRISKVTRYSAEPNEWLPKEFLTVSDLADHLLKPIELEVGRLLGKPISSELKVQE